MLTASADRFWLMSSVLRNSRCGRGRASRRKLSAALICGGTSRERVGQPAGAPGKAEFKTVTAAGPNTLKNQIQDGLKQPPTVVVDVRGTSITKAQAARQIARVEGNVGSVQGRVILLTHEGIVKH